MKHQTADFARLYGIVTAQLSSLARDPYWRDEPDRTWLAYLVIVFQQLFEDWERDPKLQFYLDALERWPIPRGRRVNRVFRLAGHVYLHVAYDLVRGIAGTLEAPSPVLPGDLHLVGSSAGGFDQSMLIKRPGARLTFLAAAPAFAAALDSEEGVDLLGDVTMWAKVLGVLTRRKRRLALQTIGQWVLALRNAALITAETIADSPPQERAAIVQRLREGIERAQTDVSERYSIADVRPWTFPILGVPLPLALENLRPWADVLVWILLFLGGWIFALSFIRRRQRELLDAINGLGEAMLQALIAARGDGKRLEKTPN